MHFKKKIINNQNKKWKLTKHLIKSKQSNLKQSIKQTKINIFLTILNFTIKGLNIIKFLKIKW